MQAVTRAGHFATTPISHPGTTNSPCANPVPRAHTTHNMLLKCTVLHTTLTLPAAIQNMPSLATSLRRLLEYCLQSQSQMRTTPHLILVVWTLLAALCTRTVQVVTL